MADEVEVKPEATPETQTPDATPKEVTPATDETLLSKEVKETPEEKPVEKVIPEKYELKAPEGMTIDNGMLEGLTPVFKEIGITQEQAQKLADVYAPMLKKQAELVTENTRQALREQFEKDAETWKSDTIKELGADYEKKLAPYAKLINNCPYGKDFRELMYQSKFGNHPVVVKTMMWIASKISEDSFVEPNKQSTGGPVSIYDHPTSKETLR